MVIEQTLSRDRSGSSTKETEKIAYFGGFNLKNGPG